MAVANLVSGLWNWVYLKNEQLESADFFQAGTILHKLKDEWTFWEWAWSEMGVASLVAELYNWLYLKNKRIE